MIWLTARIFQNKLAETPRALFTACESTLREGSWEAPSRDLAARKQMSHDVRLLLQHGGHVAAVAAAAAGSGSAASRRRVDFPCRSGGRTGSYMWIRGQLRSRLFAFTQVCVLQL